MTSQDTDPGASAKSEADAKRQRLRELLKAEAMLPMESERLRLRREALGPKEAERLRREELTEALGPQVEPPGGWFPSSTPGPAARAEAQLAARYAPGPVPDWERELEQRKYERHRREAEDTERWFRVGVAFALGVFVGLQLAKPSPPTQDAAVVAFLLAFLAMLLWSLGKRWPS